MRAKRLAFARVHVHWTVAMWKRVIFSDESWFQNMENGRRRFVRRRVGEAFRPDCVMQTVKHPLKVMIFGAISHQSKSPVIFIDGPVNQTKYQEILAEANIPAFVASHPHRDPLFMEDGATAHTAKSTRKWHADRSISLLPDWPGNSPDFNPIENCWGQMKHALSRERPSSAEGIKKVVKRVWRGITPEYLETLYESMPRRMEACIAAGGGHTKY